jgi:hypothetical protein
MTTLKRLKKRLEITRGWAADFRSAHDETEGGAFGVDPIIHQAMRDSFLAQAQDLEAELRILERAIRSEITFRAVLVALALTILAILVWPL